MPEYLPAHELRKLFPGISNAVIKRSAAPLGSMVASEPEHGKEAKLAGKLPRRRKRKGRAQILVTLIDCRQELCDDDNSSAGYKPLRDEIATTLGLDDGDHRIRFEYERCVTRGNRRDNRKNRKTMTIFWIWMIRYLFTIGLYNAVTEDKSTKDLLHWNLICLLMWPTKLVNGS